MEALHAAAGVGNTPALPGDEPASLISTKYFCNTDARTLIERALKRSKFNVGLTIPAPGKAGYICTSPTAYTIQAAPLADQSGDRCGTMTLTSTGLRSHTGSGSECW